MKIFDKAMWQIDGGIDIDKVVSHFKNVFIWLDKHNMLSEEGREELEFGIDEEASLNDELVNEEGILFLEKYYDKYLEEMAKGKYGMDKDCIELDKYYDEFLKGKIGD